ncbi:neo-calmodulin-like [Acanthaster planci]|uniref:Neo-calmodulin-like n=1 Tax=Acanthaster planci TaxID=133434 RepID=A0A8B7YEY1_ACAPL|nr:neo-calmodulin-like [Acanthaster planci]
MAGTLSAEKKKAYKETFSSYDKNRDGKMNKNELRGLLRALNRNPTETSLKKIMEGFDKNKTGILEYDEFVQLMIKIDADIDQKLRPTFEEYDKDNNGYISPEELDALLQDMGIELTPEKLQAEIKNVDLNTDGKLTFQEFKKLICRI